MERKADSHLTCALWPCTSKCLPVRIPLSGDRLKDFYVGVTDNLPTTVAPTPSPINYELCHHYAGQVPQGARERILCDGPVTGRYLIVQLTGTNYLTLCAVEAYASKSTESQCAQYSPNTGLGHK